MSRREARKRKLAFRCSGASWLSFDVGLPQSRPNVVVVVPVSGGQISNNTQYNIPLLSHRASSRCSGMTPIRRDAYLQCFL